MLGVVVVVEHAHVLVGVVVVVVGERSRTEELVPHRR